MCQSSQQIVHIYKLIIVKSVKCLKLTRGGKVKFNDKAVNKIENIYKAT